MLKRLLTFVFLFALFSSPAFAVSPAILAGNMGGTSCTTANDGQLTAFEATSDTFRSVNATFWRGQSFQVTCATTWTLTEYSFYVDSADTQDGTCYVELWADDVTTPGLPEFGGSAIAGTIVTTNCDDWPSEPAETTFTLPTPKTGLSCNTTYHVVARSPDMTTGGCAVYREDDGVQDPGNATWTGDGGTNWAADVNANDNWQGNGVYGCTN